MKKTALTIHSTVERPPILLLGGLVFVLLLFLTSFSACCRFFNDGNERACFIPKPQPIEKNKQDYIDTESVLTSKNRVSRLILSSNRKRLILETCGDVQSSVLHHGDDQVNVELWNIEFADARPENFSSDNNFIAGSASGVAAFDQKGERLFWLEHRVSNQYVCSSRGELQDTVIRGTIDNEETVATQIGLAPKVSLSKQSSLRPLPLYLPWEELGESEESDFSLNAEVDRSAEKNQLKSVEVVEGENTPFFTLGDSSLQGADIDEDITETITASDSPVSDEAEKKSLDSKLNLSLPLSEVLDISSQSYVNTLKTKPLETDAFLFASPESDVPIISEIKRVKTSPVAKDAQSIWLSPLAKWLVCRTSTEEETSSESLASNQLSESNKNNRSGEGVCSVNSQLDESDAELFSHEWALIPVRDRKRVIRFPKTIKMDCESSSFDGDIRGEIVDILAVSDSEDLVATLVQEQTQNPQYNIVIWDLNVALTVDLEKALTPLRAIEVSQIVLPHPVSRKFCKFSPSGKSFAVRVDPHYVSVWQSTNGRLIVELGEHSGIVQDFEFSPGETKMVVGTGDIQGQLFLWEIRKGVVFQVLDAFPGNVKSVDAVTFSSNERYVYFANDLGEVRRWDIRAKVRSFD